MKALVRQSKRAGLPPAEYAKQLIEESLAVQQEARDLPFAQIMGPVRASAGRIDDQEIVAVVDAARNRYYSRLKKQK